MREPSGETGLGRETPEGSRDLMRAIRIIRIRNGTDVLAGNVKGNDRPPLLNHASQTRVYNSHPSRATRDNLFYVELGSTPLSWLLFGSCEMGHDLTRQDRVEPVSFGRGPLLPFLKPRLIHIR